MEALPVLSIPAALGPAVVAAYVAAQVLVVAYSSHRYLTLWRWWRGRDRDRRPPVPAPPSEAALPPVTVQLPVYNECAVVERLIDAAARLDYPRDRLEIQVLDDSTDETTAIARKAVARHRAAGVGITLLHRSARDGFKAGALAAGLRVARGGIVVVFDADFVPPPGFLRAVVPHFADPRVGMVQARWTHLNRERGHLTAAQAVMLDPHFLLEHQTRMEGGLFFNFNGTAGAWRRTCIEDAGGWSHDTLTEDLDLSYRAQLRGWRFVFDPTLCAPAELPGDIDALKSQQRRWAKGSIQTARKLLPAILASPLPRRVKLEALVHLTNNASYPLLLALGLLLIPVLVMDDTASPWQVAALHLAVVALGIAPVCIFLAFGQRLGGRPWRRALPDVASAIVLGIGLTLNNSRAVLEGLGGRVGHWERTPKTGEAGRGPARPRYPRTNPHAGWGELGLAGVFGLTGAWGLYLGHPTVLPFAALLIAGLGWVGFLSLRPPRGRATRAKVHPIGRLQPDDLG